MSVGQVTPQRRHPGQSASSLLALHVANDDHINQAYLPAIPLARKLLKAEMMTGLVSMETVAAH